MIEKQKIESLVNEFIEGTGIFLVTIKASSANKITVIIDTMKGVTIDECVSLHRFLEKKLDRNIEDYDMQVSSPGLDTPFTVIEQYYKNEGEKVEVLTVDGMKYSGILKNVTDGGFELETEIKVRGKQKEKKEISFNLDQVKSTRIVLTI